jgi:hypothetical protein
MVLALVGLLFLALGLFCGVVLLAAPFGWFGLTAGMSMWILFPLFSSIGYFLFAAGARAGSVRALTVAVSVSLLLLASAAAVGIVMDAASVYVAANSVLPLWCVLVVAGLLGSMGAAALNRDVQA